MDGFVFERLLFAVLFAAVVLIAGATAWPLLKTISLEHVRHFSGRWGRAAAFAILACVCVAVGGSKNNPSRGRAQAPSAPSRWTQEEVSLGYVLAQTGASDIDTYLPPQNAIRVPAWQNCGWANDFRWLDGVTAGLNGTLTTAHHGIEQFPFEVATNETVFAPFMATNGLVHGVSDFWCADGRYVWRNMALERNVSNLVSFAATVADDSVAFEYGDLPASGNYVVAIQNNGVFTNLAELVESNTSYRFANIEGLDDGTGDADGDGLADYEEVMIHRTDPRNPDSDYDGLSDGAELALGANPGNPDTDGDGLADGIDPQPLVADAVTHFGTDEMWCRAYYDSSEFDYFAGGMAKWNQDAIDQGAYEIVVNAQPICEGIATSLRIDDKMILFKTNSVFKVLVPPAKEILIETMGSVRSVVAVPEDVVVSCRGAVCWMAYRPINLAVIGAEDMSSSGFASVTAKVAPAITFSRDWNASANIYIANPHALDTEIAWYPDNDEDEERDGWLSLSCTNRYVALSYYEEFKWIRPETETKLLSLSDNGGASGAILTHCAYTNAPGEVHAMTSTVAAIQCEYRGNTHGILTLSSESALPSGVSMKSIASDGSLVAETLPRSWTADGGGQWNFQMDSSSDNIESIETMTLRLRFVPESGNALETTPATVSRISITSNADANFPENKVRHVFGPREMLTLAAATSVRWRIPCLSIDTNASDIVLLTPDNAGSWTVSADCLGASLDLPYSTIYPDSEIDTSRISIPADATLWEPGSAEFPGAGDIGCAFLCWPRLMPDYVSFSALNTCESEVDASNVTGIFTNMAQALVHGKSNGGGKTVAVLPGNYILMDFIGGSLPSSFLGAEGGWTWDIKNGWFLEGSSVTNSISWSPQRFYLSPDGTFAVSKFGHFVSRGTNNVYTIYR